MGGLMPCLFCLFKNLVKPAYTILECSLKQMQYCFANISALKTPIFIKFEIYTHNIVKNYQKIFCKDLCTHTHTRGVNIKIGAFVAEIFAKQY